MKRRGPRLASGAGDRLHPGLDLAGASCAGIGLFGAGLDGDLMNRYKRQAYALRRLSKAVDRQILGDEKAGRWHGRGWQG